MYNLICKHCSSHFQSEWTAALFCSDKCRIANWREQKREEKKKHIPHSKCRNCGQDFPHKNPKKEFCTQKCKSSYHAWVKREYTDKSKNDAKFRFEDIRTPEDKLRDMLLQALDEQEGKL